MATTTAKKEPVAATPWGAASVLEEVSVPQRAGDKRFAVVVQLLEASMAIAPTAKCHSKRTQI